jgi:uncharacterized membrane protein (UPF0182 family)
MRRNMRDRVAALAPFLTFDQDPYMVVGDDGRLFWMMDAFTTSDSYPYSTHYALGDATDQLHAQQRQGGDRRLQRDNDVLRLRHARTRSWRRLPRHLSQPVQGCRGDARGPARHVRYPELLFKLQAEVYGLYHMTNPEVFFNREDLWTVATETGTGDNGEQTKQAMQPNFVLMKLPGESGVEFVEILPFTPANRNNLIGWIAGRCDGANYGTSVVYDFPKTRLVDGPQQIEARIDQNAQLSGQLTLWNQQGSHVRARQPAGDSVGQARCCMPSRSTCRRSRVRCRSCAWWCWRCRTSWRMGRRSRRRWRRCSAARQICVIALTNKRTRGADEKAVCR